MIAQKCDCNMAKCSKCREQRRIEYNREYYRSHHQNARKNGSRWIIFDDHTETKYTLREIKALLRDGKLLDGTLLKSNKLWRTVMNGQLVDYRMQLFDKLEQKLCSMPIPDKEGLSERHEVFYAWLKAQPNGVRRERAAWVWFGKSGHSINSVLNTLDKNGLLTSEDGSFIFSFE